MPPNVVVVVCDDLGYGDLGCYGADYETPNVDGLAESGVRCTDWHSNAPVCSPSRAAYLTGRYPRRAGVPSNVGYGRGDHDPGLSGLPPSEETFASRLSAAGYATGAVGKWHLGMGEADGPRTHGFDSFFGFRSGCVDYYSHTFVWGQGAGVEPYHDLFEDGEEVWHNGEFLTDLITDRAVEFVEEHAGEDEPFCLYTAYNAPHYPMHAPAADFERFSHLSEERQVQAAMVAGIDRGVGAILDALEREGVREDTVVVFTADHGPSREPRNHMDGTDGPYFGGSAGGFRGHKFSLFEGGHRVPGIVSYPGTVDAGECDTFVAGIDLFPTLLEFCDVSLPDHHVDGTSLVDLLAGDGGPPHEGEVVCWEQNDQLAARRDEWKLVVDGEEPNVDAGPIAELHLSNLAEDPAESENLAAERPDLAAELATAAREWRADLGS
jgi:arylsulfatase A-like enzyme